MRSIKIDFGKGYSKVIPLSDINLNLTLQNLIDIDNEYKEEIIKEEEFKKLLTNNKVDDVKLYKWLKQGGDPYIVGDFDNNLIREAIRNEDYISLNLLLKHGFDINHIYSNINNQTIIYYIGSGDSFEMLEFLLKNGANPNHQNYRMDTPLIHYLKNNSIAELKNVELFINYGANINLENIEYKKAIDYVSGKNKNEILTYLQNLK